LLPAPATIDTAAIVDHLMRKDHCVSYAELAVKESDAGRLAGSAKLDPTSPSFSSRFTSLLYSFNMRPGWRVDAPILLPEKQ
jgi:hypothetical protein